MNGDPFATIVERGKLALDGLRRYWEGVWAEENKPVAAVRIEPQTHSERGGDCPTCNAPGAMREVCQNVLRCASCGWQPRVINAPGIARSKLASFTYPDREHQQKFQRGFNDALWRIRGHGK